MTFQSTRPVRGATSAVSNKLGVPAFQSTRPVRGATFRNHEKGSASYISIHAPRAGRDLLKLTLLRGDWIFQSTRPVRGATGADHGGR